ncbi:phage baseplate assembly protein V [Pseudomonas cerasi]
MKFHWDRLAKGDGTSSCWVRVSSAWAGQGFGGVQIPPVNDEVVVDFINGDPDRPLIIGRVYIEASMPPWALPAATQNRGTRWLDSRSSLPHGLLIPSRLFALHRQSAVPAFRWPHYGTSKSPGFPHHQ